MLLKYLSIKSASDKIKSGLLKTGVILSFSLFSSLSTAAFEVVALGVDGGVSDGNLTSYLIRNDSQPLYLGLDAVPCCQGSLVPWRKAILQRSPMPWPLR